MEKLKYIIEDSTIAELLGVQSFTNKESAMLELVKNAFDAQATELNIIFKNDEIIIKDNGNGMNVDDIRRHWMHVGKSDKDYEIIDKNNKKRVLAGSKGIGRFALSRLGSNIQLYSQKNNQKDKSVFWTTDWNESTLEENDLLEFYGTKIIIKKLRDKWNRPNIDKLSKYLSRTCNDSLMKINIIFENNIMPVQRYFIEPTLGYNCTSKIKLQYSSKDRKLVCTINSDEFKVDANKYCEGINLSNYINTVDIFSELEGEKDIILSKDELENALEVLGNFSAEFYFSLKEPASKEIEKFLYKYSILLGRYENGIILYRNSFSISSYDGIKDWLKLGKRSRLSPAAATHPTGSWRIRENQLAGKVEIDKKTNYMLTDLANRQGLDENIYYEIFIKILDVGLTIFERYRQNIIRKINKKNIIDAKTEKKVIDKIIKNPNIMKDLSKDEVNKFISEVKEYKKENSDFKKEIYSTEERYKYDVRILNVLATSGLKATSIAHEMHNDRNSIAENCDDIIDAMKQYGIWDFVNEKERTKYAYSNIPELLDKNRNVNSKMISFMNTMLTEVEKSQFFAEQHNILELLKDIKNVWEKDYAWIEVKLDLSALIVYFLPRDVLKVIFDNLILNSIQQNDDRNHLCIFIQTTLNNDFLEFLYKDDGKGLNKKYIDDPMKIVEVHETSRKQGHGLGMWIVNNTVVMSGGEIKKIEGLGGFTIQFTIGGKSDG
ncbi:sensor histidine kinase [Clostridium botulinum]|nr:sensor histidine kinase [Clostridium botulinum]NFL60339.1 sensor histidine kinase [Clostridium botulinum]NFL61573.1 sensor histidine kinase [Clostridium botulinum]NFO68269.1 sensor histidine kinase [Clostridium botulinum]